MRARKMKAHPNQLRDASLIAKHHDQSTPSNAVLSLIVKARISRGISVAELARRIYTDRKRLWYVLNGQREMRVDEFLRLCIVLQLDPRIFITREMVEEIADATRRSIER